MSMLLLWWGKESCDTQNFKRFKALLRVIDRQRAAPVCIAETIVIVNLVGCGLHNEGWPRKGCRLRSLVKNVEYLPASAMGRYLGPKVWLKSKQTELKDSECCEGPDASFPSLGICVPDSRHLGTTIVLGCFFLVQFLFFEPHTNYLNRNILVIFSSEVLFSFDWCLSILPVVLLWKQVEKSKPLSLIEKTTLPHVWSINHIQLYRQ